MTDGREYLGILLSVDKTGSIFLQDALELVEVSDKKAFVHDMFTPNLVALPIPDKDASSYPEIDSKRFHYMSNYVISRQHVKRICLDRKA